MKRFLGAAFAGSMLIGSVQADLIYSFETDTEGLHSLGGSTVAQSTIGATEGTHSLAITNTGGFSWVETPSSGPLATALLHGTKLLIDVTVPSSLGNWGSQLLSFNDAHGWRQMATSTGYSGNPGTYTIALDYSTLAAPDFAAQGWFKMCIGVGQDQSPRTIYIDNVRSTDGTHVPVTSVATTQGTRFSGNLASLSAVDNDRYAAFNDDTSLVTEIQMGITFQNPPASLKFAATSSASRPGLAYNIGFLNVESGDFDDLASDEETLNESEKSLLITSNVAAYVSDLDGSCKAHFLWMPFNDEVPSQDGWLTKLNEAHFVVP